LLLVFSRLATMACASGSASEYLPALLSALIRALCVERSPFWASPGVASDAVIASAKPVTHAKRRRAMNPLAVTAGDYGVGSQRCAAAFNL
jgi:hypothetical protein